MRRVLLACLSLLPALAAAQTAKPQKGLWAPLLKAGAKSVLTADTYFYAGPLATMTIEVTDVRSVGAAQVARLRWTIDDAAGARATTLPALGQVALTGKGLYAFAGTEDDAAIKKAIKKAPALADPPKLGAAGKSGWSVEMEGDAVCLDWDAARAGDAVCRDESCAGHLCLGAAGVVRVDGRFGQGQRFAATKLAPADPPSAEIAFSQVTASSKLPDWKDYNFEEKNLCDGQLTTAWQPDDKKDGGVGEWLEIDLEGDWVVDAIEIANGYQAKTELGDLFAKNARIKAATVKLGDGSILPLSFAADTRGFVRTEVGGKTTRTIRITVDSVHPGAKWPDLGVSEIRVFGRPVVGRSQP